MERNTKEIKIDKNALFVRTIKFKFEKTINAKFGYCKSKFHIRGVLGFWVVENIEDFVKYSDNIINFVEVFDNIIGKKILHNIKTRKLYKYLGDFDLEQSQIKELNSMNSYYIHSTHMYVFHTSGLHLANSY